MSDQYDSLDGKRIRTTYRGHLIYGMLWEKSGKIHAIQASVSDPEINRDAYTQSDIEAIFRLSSLVVREYGADVLVRELRNCSYNRKSLPSLVADLVEKYGGGGMKHNARDWSFFALVMGVLGVVLGLCARVLWLVTE